MPGLATCLERFSNSVRPCAEQHFRAQYVRRNHLKILAVSDVVVDRLYSAHVAEYFRDVSMILGCGDLPYEYLDFLVSALNAPLLYVPGNHDPQYNEAISAAQAGGCDLLDRR